MIEMFKIKNELDFMFERRNKSYNLRNFQEFLTERKRTVHYGFETLSNRCPQLCSLLHKTLRMLNHSKFCPYRLRKTYWHNIGFL